MDEALKKILGVEEPKKDNEDAKIETKHPDEFTAQDKLTVILSKHVAHMTHDAIADAMSAGLGVIPTQLLMSAFLHGTGVGYAAFLGVHLKHCGFRRAQFDNAMDELLRQVREQAERSYMEHHCDLDPE